MSSAHRLLQEALPILVDDKSYFADLANVQNLIAQIRRNITPSVEDAGEPQFYSTVFASADQLEFDAREGSSADDHVFYALRRLNRFSTTALLRQLQAFDIRAPVFGVLLSHTLVAIHVDWIEETPYDDSVRPRRQPRHD